MGNMVIEEMKKKLKEHTSLVSGDWLELSKQLKSGSGSGGLTSQTQNNNNMPQDGKFDLILASETTYTPNAAQDTAYWLCNHLKPHTGVGLIATKRYYFGVGLGACGGSDAFQNACKCANEKFHSTSDGERDCDGERDGERDGDGDCYHGSSMHTNYYRLSIELVQQYNDGKSNI